MPTGLSNVLLIAAAGAVGAVSRWAISLLMFSVTQRPWAGTLLANVLGCFLFALIYQALLDWHHLDSDHPARLAIFTGFLGSFTTFSTFAFDTYRLAEEHHLLYGAMNLSLNVVLGLIAVWAGLMLVKSM